MFLPYPNLYITLALHFLLKGINLGWQTDVLSSCCYGMERGFKIRKIEHQLSLFSYILRKKYCFCLIYKNKIDGSKMKYLVLKQHTYFEGKRKGK